MIQFYAPDIRENLQLSPEESVHCIRVLRKKAGDEIWITDGCGLRYRCVITVADPRGVRIEILSATEIDKSWDFNLTIAVAPTKNADRMAWLVEKCTEVGVDRIIFMECRHSERKNINVSRLRRNAISAMNQSLKTRLPEIPDLQPFDRILELEGEKYFGYCDFTTERVDYAMALVSNRAPGNIIVAIGPEGDFSPEEVNAMKEAGFLAVTFGDERLRTETAAFYSATAAHILIPRFLRDVTK